MKNDYEIIIIIMITIVIIIIVIIELYENYIEPLSWICKLQWWCWNITIKKCPGITLTSIAPHF